MGQFRVWDKLKKEMLYDGFIICNGETITAQPVQDGIIDWNDTYGKDNYIVIQFTGFKDKYGEPIWEGDVLQNESGITSVVEKYYGHWTWNGALLTDFRDEQIYEPISVSINGYVGVIALGHQGDTFGNETKYLKKIGHKFQ